MGDVIKMQIANFQISHGIIDVATDTRVKSDLCTFNIRLTGGLCEYHSLWSIGRKIAFVGNYMTDLTAFFRSYPQFHFYIIGIKIKISSTEKFSSMAFFTRKKCLSKQNSE